MSCCGNSSVSTAQHTQVKHLGVAAGTPHQTQRRQAVETVYFQYIGKTALTVQGMFSRQNYRFGAPLAVLAVDGRDAPGMAAVPMLKRVRAPE